MNYRLKLIQEKMGILYNLLLILLMSILIFALAYPNIKPKKLSFSLNQIAETTIQAPMTVEDTVQTELNREKARESVADVFVFQSEIGHQQVEELNAYFEELLKLRNQNYSSEQLLKIAEEVDIESQLIRNIEKENRDIKHKVPFGQLNESEELIAYYYEFSQLSESQQKLANQIPNNIISRLLQLSDEEIIELKNLISDQLANILDKEVQHHELNQIITQTNQQMSQLGIKRNNQPIVKAFLQELIVPTMVYSPIETDKKREEMANQVATSYILEGQIIVQEGHIVDQENLRQLDVVGLTHRQGQQETVYIYLLLIILHAFLLRYAIKKIPKEDSDCLLDSQDQLTAYTFIFSSAFIILKILHLVQVSGLTFTLILFPIYLWMMLLLPKVNRYLSFLFVIAFNILSLFIIQDSQSISSIFLISSYLTFNGFFAIIYYSRVGHFKLLKNTFLVTISGLLVYFLTIMTTLNISLISNNGLLIASLLFAGISLSYLSYFLIEPYWEELLSEKAPVTLNQLGNINHPLLNQLMELAPGSYQHSVMVANLSAAASDAIGINALLTRIASYYHDVGKIIHPMFFIENIREGMESPHSFLEPQESAKVIIDHVEEGVKLLQEHQLPLSVIDICQQHHGTTSVKYFLNKAEKSQQNFNHEDFYYAGPKPQTKEAMVVMLADSVEAACRSMKEYSQESIEKLVENIVESKINEKQFESCGMTVNELELVKSSLIRTLSSMYHSRIKYPE